MASLSYLVLYLCFHACCARPLMDVITNHHIHTKALHFPNQGKNVRTQANGAEVLYSWKILQQPIGVEKWKRADRSTLQKSSENVEDIDVMDYAQPHRKPPIHNWGT